MAEATFAGGCFWCMEPPFEKLPGVAQVLSGYTGGDEVNPTYEQVGSGRTGHAEAVRITYDPAVLSYASLVEVYWRQINPTDGGGQFADRGRQYRPGIFYANAEQKRIALASKSRLEESKKFDRPIAVEVTACKTFYPAEEYHQDFYKKNYERYHSYRQGSGRESYVDRVWGKKPIPLIPVTKDNDGMDEGNSKAGLAKGAVGMENGNQAAWKGFKKPEATELRKRLTPLQFKVTQENGTERAFTGEYHDNHKEGIYVDIVSGEPLFSSKDKFESGTGWPSFTRVLEPGNLVDKSDKSLGMDRMEVRSKLGNSHLGHLFDDGPKPTGLRYCINSASLRFIPKEKLVAEGYGEYVNQFDVAGTAQKQ